MVEGKQPTPFVKRTPWTCAITWGLTASLLASVLPVWGYRSFAAFRGTSCQTTFWGMLGFAAEQVSDSSVWNEWLRYYLPQFTTMVSVFVVCASLGWVVEWRRSAGPDESD